jgi:pimeloyl-ACP methyl ester carboxylesterase
MLSHASESPRIAPYDYIKGGIQYGLHSAYEAVQNLSFRDKSKAAEKIATVLGIGEPVMYLEPEEIPATQTSGIRLKHTATIRRGNHTHAFVITEPVSSEETDTDVILHSAGITQQPNEGNGRITHDALSAAFPRRRVISPYQNGTGKFESNLSIREIWNLTFQEIARERLDTIQRLIGNDPVDAVGNSMGTVTTVNLAALNAETGQLTLNSMNLIAPAVVEPDAAYRVLGYEFPAAQWNDQLQEKKYGRIRMAARCIRWATDIPAPFYGNAYHLSSGTDVELFERAVGSVPRTSALFGTEDCLPQLHLLHAAAAKYPGRVALLPLEGVNHSIAGCANTVAEHIRDFVEEGHFKANSPIAA